MVTLIRVPEEEEANVVFTNRYDNQVQVKGKGGEDENEQRGHNAQDVDSRKHSPSLEQDGKEMNKCLEKKRQKKQKFIDLTGVPMQLPIESGSTGQKSKYKGVAFDKTCNKWRARIRVDGKLHSIGQYLTEEAAAADYARAFFKYGAGNGKRTQVQKKQKFIDLTGVPMQLPIESRRTGEKSKYKGVAFDKTRNKWRARIGVDGKLHSIGQYDTEEAAAIDYARAAFKYRVLK